MNTLMKPFNDIFGELEGKAMLRGPRTTLLVILIIYNSTFCKIHPYAPARADSTMARGL